MSNSLTGIKKDHSKNELPADIINVKTVGRKAKPKSEKASKAITLKFTEDELKQIEKKAGLVPRATFLKELLLSKTDLLE